MSTFALISGSKSLSGGRSALATLAVALVFAAIFLFGGRAARFWERRGHGLFLSFATGVSVAYVFVHVLPVLSAIRELHTGAPDEFRKRFPEYSVYLWAMLGFLVFDGLEMAEGAPPRSGGSLAKEQTFPWRLSVHIAGFAVYAWLLSYLMVWTRKPAEALGLYAVAMGMHILPVGLNLRGHHPAAYDRFGAPLLATASLAGWGCAMTVSIPTSGLLDLVAFVAGGVIVNSVIVELSQKRKGHYPFFLAGTVVYAALLLTLSHFEQG